MSETSENGARGIWRASVPARAVSSWLCSFQRQSRPRLARLGCWRVQTPAPFLALLCMLVIILQAAALPLPIGLLLIDADAKAMTHGCKKESCCTSLCYLDNRGAHHCVPMHGESCECGMSSNELNSDLTLNWTAAILPENEPLFPPRTLEAWVAPPPERFADCDPATPSPPPR